MYYVAGTGHEEQGNLQGVRPGNVSARYGAVVVCGVSNGLDNCRNGYKDRV